MAKRATKGAKKARKVPKKATVTAKADQPKVTDLALPTAKKVPNFNLNEYTLLVYGREKIGKSTLFASFPDSIFFATEPGTKGLEIFELNAEHGGCKDWKIFRQGIKLLESTDKFANVIIDTVDRAYDMCMDYVCAKLGIDYPGVDATGKNDYGKSWRAVRDEFTDGIHRILQTGRGLCFTSHSKEETVRTRSGMEYTRIYPTISNQGRKVVEALVDMFFYCEYIRDSRGETRRVLITQGDETIWAGSRTTMAEDFPQFLPLLKKGGYEIISKAFRGEDVGLDPQEIMPSKSTPDTTKDFLRKQRTAAQRKEEAEEGE